MIVIGPGLTATLRLVTLLLVLLAFYPATRASGQDTLAVRFDAKRGQVEVGGPYVGAEFHHSRLLPARISFYYPVANSIDLSTDYWHRDESMPFTIRLSVDGVVDTLERKPAGYAWTPYSVCFEREAPAYVAEVSYRFAKDLPVMVFRLKLINRSDAPKAFDVATGLVTTLRTSHTYALRTPDRLRYVDAGRSYLADFDAPDTDSTQVFVLNAGAEPVAHGTTGSQPEARFDYRQTLAPGDSLVIVQLIGTTRQGEANAVRARAHDTWRAQMTAYERGITDYVAARTLFVPDDTLMQTARLAEALLRADRHYLDGHVVPMPSPAEYNFFFTHDLLLTDLGAVRFDLDRVREDLRYVQSLASADDVLPHAYYWKDGAYLIEPAASDNWNHLWFILLTSAYLQHSGDTTTVADLYPILRKSVALMLENEHEGLMYAIRPDWWDIGHVYGARAYLTTLTIRALEAYVAIAHRLGQDESALPGYLDRARRMRETLVAKLWDSEAGYLLNMLDSTQIDRHYYSGSLLAVAFDILDDAKKHTLLDTAARVLLDSHLGVRNAMPADFHQLGEVYRFAGDEAGGPGLYMNGGIWPQGSAWYALALLSAGRPDEARGVLEHYLSIQGVLDSPNGQPAFYEYRNGDATSSHYGEIDKPTFLWAGGWYLNVLYGLAGVRENPWSLSLAAALPDRFDNVAYDLMVDGAPVRITYRGEGAYFHNIRIDGRPAHSAVLTGPAERIDLVRGGPETPYLAAATARISAVDFDPGRRMLSITLEGIQGQHAELEVISPSSLRRVIAAGTRTGASRVSRSTEGVMKVRLPLILDGGSARVDLLF